MKTITDELGTYELEEISDESFDIPYLCAGLDRNWNLNMDRIGKLTAYWMSEALFKNQPNGGTGAPAEHGGSS